MGVISPGKIGKLYRVASSYTYSKQSRCNIMGLFQRFLRFASASRGFCCVGKPMISQSRGGILNFYKNLFCRRVIPEIKEAFSDQKTQQYYRNNARALAQRYARARGGIELWFDAAFPKGSKILDVGAAAGRDVLLLLEAGYDACGVDPCQELVAEGLRRGPVLKDRLAFLERLLNLWTSAIFAIT